MTGSFYYLHEDFQKSLNRLESDEQIQVRRAVDRYREDRHHPSLKLKPLRGSSRRWWTIRASDELRVLLVIRGSVTLFFRAGHHDEVYRWADTKHYLLSRDGALKVVAIKPQGVREPKPEVEVPVGRVKLQTGDAQGRLLHTWGYQDLLDAGFSPDDVEFLRELTVEGWDGALGRFGEDQLLQLAEMSEVSPEEWREQQLLDDADAKAERFRHALVSYGAIAGLSNVLSDEELRKLMRAPIEDWMIFLHPAQREVVERRYRGAARVSGSAGTGKTVVALHRAAWLANRRDEAGQRAELPILFTTYIRSLPPTLASLYERLPNADAAGVKFINIDRLANQLATEAHGRPKFDFDVAGKALDDAIQRVVTRQSLLARFTRRYLEDEIERVIKGRLLTTLEGYLAIDRRGRGTAFTPPIRRQMWELYEAYQSELVAQGVVTFADVTRLALEAVEASGKPRYSHAIVDEAQDLTLAQLHLVRALVSGHRHEPDQADRLLLVGDGAQRIYAGGYSLREAGVDVRGSSTILRRNYRNTKEIIETSMACTGDRQIEDIDDESYRAASAEHDAVRSDQAPRLVEAWDLDDQGTYIASQIADFFLHSVADLREIAVLASFNWPLDKIEKQLEQHGINCKRLDADGKPVLGAVRTGTFHRAKGLEFKIVFIVGMSQGVRPSFPLPRQNQSDAEYAEQLALNESALHVAMTRARDGLYVLYNGQASQFLESGLGHFEGVRTERVIRGY